MVGVLFIITVPQKEYEQEQRLKDNATKIFIEKEKFGKSSKVFQDIRNTKRLSSKSSIESYATDDDNGIIISKCKSTDCLHRNEKEDLYKCQSEKTLTNMWDGGSMKTARDEVKRAIKPKKNKLSITRPARGIDVLGTFHSETPLETILSEILTRLDINSASWTTTRDNQFWKVTFCLRSGSLCEELLQVLRTFGVGSRWQSSMSVLPCTLYYQSAASKEQVDSKEDVWEREKSAWSRFSSSVRSRNHLPQILHAVRADASLTFDWLFLLVVAAFVAAIGLVEDSTVILVASMLISPLMGPITAGTMGTAVRDRSLQRMGVMHEMLGLFLALVIGFIFGLGICAVDEHYGVGDWPTYEMISRCEIRSLYVGILVAIPSGAAVALAVLSEYTASLVGVAISASLLPPAVNAGLLWAMALVHLIYNDDETRWIDVVTTAFYSDDHATELALMGTVSLCLTLVNIVCIFLAGVTVYKVKEVCPLDKRDIPWWRSNGNLLKSPKLNNQDTNSWHMHSKLYTVPIETRQDEKINPIQSDTVTYRRHNISGMQRLKAYNLENYLQDTDNFESHSHMEMDSLGITDFEKKQCIGEKSEIPSVISNSDSIEDRPNINTKLDSNTFEYYNLGFKNKDDVNETYYPTIEPSLNLTVDAKNHGIVLGNQAFHV